MFVVFEGLDRAGKTTQLRLLESHLLQQGIAFESFKYPDRTGAETGPLIDRFLRGAEEINWTAASFLLAANLYELVPRIEKCRAEKRWILFDRYSYSSVAYSIARGLDERTAHAMTSRMPVPDKVIFLRANPETTAERSDFGKEIFERKEFQSSVKAAFERMKKPEGWTEVDVDGMDESSVHELIKSILKII